MCEKQPIFRIKMHIRRENVQKTIDFWTKNAYIVTKTVKKGVKNGQFRIYSSNYGQKDAKKKQKNNQKRIYREKSAHFLTIKSIQNAYIGTKSGHFLAIKSIKFAYIGTKSDSFWPKISHKTHI